MVQLVTPPVLADEIERITAQLQADAPDWRNDQSSPVRYALENRVREKIADYILLNNSGQALIVEDATGNDLDQLLANYAMQRRSGESDADFRARVPAQWTGLNRDTAPGILNYVTGIEDVTDASLTRGANYAVTVYIQGPDFGASTPTLRTQAQNALNRDDFKPWYADYTVAAETRNDFSIVGTVNLDTSVTRDVNAAQMVIGPALQAVIDADRRLNRAVTLSRYVAAVQNLDEVSSVSLTFTGTGVTAMGPLAAATNVVWVGAYAFGTTGTTDISVTP